MIHSKSRRLSVARYVFAAAIVLGNAFQGQADYRSTVLSQNPVGYWRLDETVPPSVPQVTATNSGMIGVDGNGIYTNGAVKGVNGALAGEPNNKAAAFNGSIFNGTRVRVPYRPEWNVNGPFSVEFWAKPGQTDTLLCPAASTTFTLDGIRSGWLFYQTDSATLSGNGWYFRMYRSENSITNRSVSIDMPLDTNSWYHVVGSFDGINLNLYVNGALSGSVALDDTYRSVTDTNAPMTFGSRSDGASNFQWFGYVGSMDETAFYTNALSAARVLAHYQAGTNLAPVTPYSQVVLADSPAGYWRLNEPADLQPPAVNIGTLGSAADGGYFYPANPGQVGPRPSTFGGFESTNRSVAFNGTNGCVSIPAMNLNTNTVTFTAWLKRNGDQVGHTAIVLSHAGNTAAGLKFDQSVQELSYNWSDDPATISFRSYLGIPDNQWVFAALIVSPDRALLALQDGTSFAVVTNEAPHFSQSFDTTLRIGSDIQDDTLTFKGSIDEVAVFNRSLSLGEVFSQYASAAGHIAPQIFSDTKADPDQPTVGDPLLLSIDVGGTSPLHYQWRRSGTNIAGATGSTYFIPSAQISHSGDYSVVVTNSYGSIAGQEVSVTVSPLSAPVITEEPRDRILYPGGFASFRVSATGGQLSYQWRRDGTNIIGETNSVFTIPVVTQNDPDLYSVVVSNAVNQATSRSAVLTVVKPVPGSFEKAILADGPEAWWRLDESPGSTNMFDAMGRHDGIYSGGSLGTPGVLRGSSNTAVTFDGGGYGIVPYSPALNLDSFTIELWARTSAQGFPEGVLSSFSSVNESHGRGIGCTKAETDMWRGVNGKYDNQLFYYNDLGVLAPGKWTHWAVTVSANAVTWYLDGTFRLGPFPGAYVKNLSAPFYIGAFDPGGAIDLRWTGDVDEVVFYPQALTPAKIQAHYVAALYGNNSRPVFTQQPESQTVVEGVNVAFSGTAEGTPTIGLQWNRNGTPIAGATNSTMVLSNVSYADQASFVLTASNPAGTTNSAPATLTVVPSPTFANLTNELVLHLKFDGDLIDSSGRSNDGTAVGAISFVPGMLGQALHYNTDVGAGIFNYVTLGVRDDLQFGSNVDFSVSYWVRVSSNQLTGDLPFLCNSQQSFSDLGYTFAPSYFMAGWSWSLNTIGIYGGPAINDGQWHHLIHSFQRGGMALTWMDGVLSDARPTAGYKDIDTGAPTNIGQSGSGHYGESGQADLDDLGIWRRALNPYEAQSVYLTAKNDAQSFDTSGPVWLSMRKSGPDLQIIWQSGTLLQSDGAAGPWLPVPGASAPYFKVSPGTAKKFYKIRL